MAALDTLQTPGVGASSQDPHGGEMTFCYCGSYLKDCGCFREGFPVLICVPLGHLNDLLCYLLSGLCCDCCFYRKNRSVFRFSASVDILKYMYQRSLVLNNKCLGRVVWCRDWGGGKGHTKDTYSVLHMQRTLSSVLSQR